MARRPFVNLSGCRSRSAQWQYHPGRMEVRLLGPVSLAVAGSEVALQSEDPEPIPAVAALVGAARQRLAGALGTEYAEQETVGHHTPLASLLQSAAQGLDR